MPVRRAYVYQTLKDDDSVLHASVAASSRRVRETGITFPAKSRPIGLQRQTSSRDAPQSTHAFTSYHHARSEMPRTVTGSLFCTPSQSFEVTPPMAHRVIETAAMGCKPSKGLVGDVAPFGPTVTDRGFPAASCECPHLSRSLLSYCSAAGAGRRHLNLRLRAQKTKSPTRHRSD